MSLRLDWASHEAAEFACLRWHYAAAMPSGKLVKVGVWEGDSYRGVVLFGRGATGNIGRPFGLTQAEVCELVRVALREHEAPVSRIGAIALRFLRRANPGLRLVVSYADSGEGHHGGIYQAMNWVYLGPSPSHVLEVLGERVHPRSLGSRYGRGGQSVEWLRAHVDPNARRIDLPPKHKYVYPLDEKMRAAVSPLAQPYPRAGSSTVERPADQRGGGGSTPTSALQA